MKRTTAEDDPHAARRLRELVREIGVAMVTTVTPDGTLHSRPMVTQDVEVDGELWFFCSDESAIGSDLAAEPGINVSYVDPTHSRYVSVSGNGRVIPR